MNERLATDDSLAPKGNRHAPLSRSDTSATDGRALASSTHGDAKTSLPVDSCTPSGDCPYPLRHGVWEITLACCFSCSYCGSRAGIARKGELSTEECLSIADQLAQLGCKRVSMIGGEVFLRNDWDEIATRLTSQNVNVNIITNGFVFAPDTVLRIKAAHIESVSVSIDGTREAHDTLRQEGSFERAINAIHVLAEAHIPVSIITTLNAATISLLPEMYECFKTLPIFAWQLQACSPMGNAKDSAFDWRIDFRTAIDFVETHVRTAPFIIGAADNIGYCTKGEGLLRGRMANKLETMSELMPSELEEASGCMPNELEEASELMPNELGTYSRCTSDVCDGHVSDASDTAEAFSKHLADDTVQAEVFSGCSAGITGIGIDSVGNVRGCESMYDERFIEGNLRNRTLRGIWEDPASFAYNRGFEPKLLSGACATCQHGSSCAGGCRSYNFFAGGNLYESPACALVN